MKNPLNYSALWIKITCKKQKECKWRDQDPQRIGPITIVILLDSRFTVTTMLKKRDLQRLQSTILSSKVMCTPILGRLESFIYGNHHFEQFEMRESYGLVLLESWSHLLFILLINTSTEPRKKEKNKQELERYIGVNKSKKKLIKI